MWQSTALFSVHNNYVYTRLDVAASGLWGSRRTERTLMASESQPFCSLKSQGGKKSGACYFCSYIVMSATGSLSKQATNLYKRLASLLADKWDQPYSTTLHWLRCSLSFSLLRSAIQCIRGAHSSRGHAMKLSPDCPVMERHSGQKCMTESSIIANRFVDHINRFVDHCQIGLSITPIGLTLDLSTLQFH